jgi:NAD(P) transhydrogenase
MGITLLFNREVKGFEDGTVILDNDQKLEIDMFLYAAGRTGNTKELGCEKLGLQMGKRGTLVVNHNYQTNIPHIYAVGDVIGFPALASTSMDQGRVAVAHIFKTKDLEHLPQNFPYGIYTIPEVSTVGISEEVAKEKGIHYMVGRARYADMPRGKIMGTKSGFLKLIFDTKTQTILGVHIIGNIASELIHYGLSMVEEKKTLSDLIGTVFNFPTLHDLYKYAAYDGLSNLTGHKIKP